MRNHAVVLGAGIGGLVAAAALREQFAEVTVVERDLLPLLAMTRRGVPQGAQVHGLLARGMTALGELFPGFDAELRELGAPHGDMLADIRWYFDGHLLHPASCGLTAFGVSRPALEHLLGTRVRGFSNVHLRDGTAVRGLATGDGRVTGVRLDDGVLRADLVVDATGQGSRTPVWLGELGYPVPTRDEVRVDVCYVTHLVRRKAGHLDGRIGVALASYPDRPLGAFVLAQEGDTFAVMTSGRNGTVPPVDHDGLVRWMRRLGAPDVAEMVSTAEPVGEPRLMRYPASRRYRYERLRSFPDGYLVMGDALCSFNPLYGQGMTVAAMEALLLRRLLSAGDDRLAPRFFREAARLLDAPWRLAADADMRFGPQPPAKRAVSSYLGKLYRAAAHDPVLSTRLFRVANLLDSPARLLRPGTALRVLRGARS
ncbi:FAD-dependent oxidoreductase [Lentzea sp. NPDC059081]|uniref:FAD-dependent oxidoreductase n=1 Tax=Lentzea sp. NPDC059081 TaxID=3346719 RepID=UPI0036BE981A